MGEGNPPGISDPTTCVKFFDGVESLCSVVTADGVESALHDGDPHPGTKHWHGLSITPTTDHCKSKIKRNFENKTSKRFFCQKTSLECPLMYVFMVAAALTKRFFSILILWCDTEGCRFDPGSGVQSFYFCKGNLLQHWFWNCRAYSRFSLKRTLSFLSAIQEVSKIPNSNQMKLN